MDLNEWRLNICDNTENEGKTIFKYYILALSEKFKKCYDIKHFRRAARYTVFPLKRALAFLHLIIFVPVEHFSN